MMQYRLVLTEKADGGILATTPVSLS